MSTQRDKFIGWIGFKHPAHVLCIDDHMLVVTTAKEAQNRIKNSGLAIGYAPSSIRYSDVIKAIIIGDGVVFDCWTYKQFYRAVHNDDTNPLRGKMAHFSTIKPGETVKIKQAPASEKLKQFRDDTVAKLSLKEERPN